MQRFFSDCSYYLSEANVVPIPEAMEPVTDAQTAIEGFLFAFGPSRSGGEYCHYIYCVLLGRHFQQFRAKGDEVPLRSGILDSQLRLEDTGRKVVCGQTLYTIRLYSLADSADSAKEVLLGASSSEGTAAWLDAFKAALALPLPSSASEPTADAGHLFPLIGSLSLPSPLMRGSSSLPDLTAVTEGQAEAKPAATDGRKWGAGAAASPRSITGRQQSVTTQVTTIGSVPAPAAPSSDKSRPQEAEIEEAAAVAVEGAAVSKWRLVRCYNSLRFFEEVNDSPFVHTFYKLPVMKSVGVVKAAPNAVFDLVMSYGEERSQWDPSIEGGEVLETLDGHSDVVAIRLRHDWIWLRMRDLCLSRYWKREENGAYLIFFQSTEHPKYPQRRGAVRALIRSGGYVITPLKARAGGKPRCLVEHVVEVDVGGWSSWFGIGLSPYPAHVRDTLLGSVAGIREYYAAQRVDSSNTVVQRHLVEGPFLPGGGPGSPLPPPLALALHPEALPLTSFLDTEDVEEFFDARAENLSSDSEPQTTGDWLGVVVEGSSPVQASPLPDYLTGEWQSPRDAVRVEWGRYQGNVPPGPLLGGRNCWSRPDGNLFHVRSRTFLSDGSRVAGGEPIARLVAVDWFASERRVDNVASRPQSIVQRVGARHGRAGGPFFFLINLQVPGSPHRSLVFYFALERKIVEGSLLHRFVHGDDSFRNSRITLIPVVPEGSWLVKQAVGSRPVALGQIMELRYCSGTNFLEIDANMGSSSVVRGVMGMVIGYINMLVVDMAFLIKGDSEEELPERILGAVRCSHIELTSAAPPAEAEQLP